MAVIYRFLEHVGRFSIMLKQSIGKPENARIYRKEFFDQCYATGIGSLPIVLIISAFMGMVMTIQTAYQMISPIIPKPIIASIIRDSSILELSPTVTCIVLAGVIGSRLSSELGNMKVGEQIDAMEIIGVNTRSYLIMPRIASSLLMIPCLISLSIAISIFGGFLAGAYGNILTEQEYIRGLRANFRPYTITVAFVKSATYAFVISSISCYFGYHVEGGAVEIGKSSTTSVVVSCIIILLMDYIITSLML